MPKTNNEIIVTEGHFEHVGFLDNLMFFLTGRRYRYEIEITYYYHQFDNGQWDGEKYVCRVVQHGTASQKSLDFDYRHQLHKQVSELMMKEMPREFLRNGMLKITRIDYLGRW